MDLIGSILSKDLGEVTKILDHGADINAQGGEYDNALQAAAAEGDEAIVQLLLERGADINGQGGKYGNALQAAAACGDEAKVRLLLDRGADINAQGGEYGNALQAAALRGYEGIVQLLLDGRADSTIQPWLSDRLSLLHNAILSMNTLVLKQLLANGAHVHIKSTDNFGQTPLHLAVRANQIEMAQCLLNEGASPDETDFTDTSVLQSAVQGGSREIVLLLYPRAKRNLASLAASDWRNHFNFVSRSDLEVIDGKEAQVNSIDNLKDHVFELSYPMPSFSITQAVVNQSHFMQQHRKARRML